MVEDDVAIICAWCNQQVSGSGSRVSHGICVECAMSFLRKLPPEYRATITGPDGNLTLFPAGSREAAGDPGS